MHAVWQTTKSSKGFHADTAHSKEAHFRERGEPHPTRDACAVFVHPPALLSTSGDSILVWKTPPTSQVDFVVLLLSYVDIVGVGEAKQARVLRLGRALRPLRLIKRNPGLRLIVDALLATWRSVSMIILLATSLAVVFSCVGMACFQGTFNSCSDAAGPAAFPFGKTECSGTWMSSAKLTVANPSLTQTDDQILAGEEISFLSPRAWLLPSQNFDSFPRAMISLAAVNCFSYADVLKDASNGVGKDRSPRRDHNAVVAAVFFVVYTISASLFVMNLFVAFIIDGFNQVMMSPR